MDGALGKEQLVWRSCAGSIPGNGAVELPSVYVRLASSVATDFRTFVETSRHGFHASPFQSYADHHSDLPPQTDRSVRNTDRHYFGIVIRHCVRNADRHHLGTLIAIPRNPQTAGTA